MPFQHLILCLRGKQGLCCVCAVDEVVQKRCTDFATKKGRKLPGLQTLPCTGVELLRLMEKEEVMWDTNMASLRANCAWIWWLPKTGVLQWWIREEQLSYRDRLKDLERDKETLEKRRFCGYLLLAFQYLKGLQEIWRGTFLQDM